MMYKLQSDDATIIQREAGKPLKEMSEDELVSAMNRLGIKKLEITEENLPVFKELRLKIRDNRTKGIEKWHKLNKAFFLHLVSQP